VLVRPSSTVVVNLEHIKALIKADRVVVFDTDAQVEESHQWTFVADLKERLRGNNNNNGTNGNHEKEATAAPATAAVEELPFELKAIEAILLSVCNVLSGDFNKIKLVVDQLLEKLEREVDNATMVKLLEMSKKLTRLETRVVNIQHALAEILKSDEDMYGAKH